MLPLLPPPRRRLRGGGRRESRAQTAQGRQIFKENLPGIALLPENARDHMVTTATPRLSPHPLSPPLWGLPAGNSRIHWGLVHPYHEQAEFGRDHSRPLDLPVHLSSLANSVWQLAEARNRSRAREPDRSFVTHPHPPHPVDASDRSRSWAPHRPLIDRSQPQDFAARPAPADPSHRLPQPPGHPEPRGPCTTRYDLDQPAWDRHQDTQRPQESSAGPPGGHSFAPKPCHAYRKRAMPLPVRSRRSPTHDLSDAEAPPQWSYSPRSPPGKASHRVKDDLRDTAITMPPFSRNLHKSTTRRETRHTPGRPRQGASTTTARNLSLPPRRSRTTCSLRSST